MDRLTERDEYGNADIIGVDSGDLQLNLEFDEFNRVTDALNRLAAYEDTGLTPEDVPTALEMSKIYVALQKLKAYEQAEAEGRMIVLPCDANVTLRYNGLEYKADHWNPPYLTAFADDLTVPSKQRLHLFSPEAAEAALKEEQG